MANEVEGLNAKISGDSAEFNRALAAAQKMMKKFDQEAEALSAALGRATAGMQKSGGQSVRMGSQVDKAARALNKLETAAIGAGTAASRSGARLSTLGRSVRAFRGQAGQVSMQVQDMAVQFAAGTNAFTVMGQQLPQLTSAFGKVGQIIGAILAIGLPVMGAAFLGTSRSAKVLTTEIEAAAEALKSYADALDSASQAGVGLSTVDSDLRKIAEIKAFKAVEDLAAAIDHSVTGAWNLKTAFADVKRLLDIGTTGLFAAGEGRLKEAAQDRRAIREYIDTLEQLQEASTLEDILANATKLRDVFKQRVDVSKDMSEEQLTYLENLTRLIENTQGLLDVEQKVAEQRRNAAMAARQDADNQIKAIRDRMALEIQAMRTGKDSLEVLRLRNAQETENLRIKLEQQYAADGLTDAEKRFISEIIAAKREHDNLLEGMKLAHETIQKLKAVADGLTFDAAITGAGTLATKLKAAYDHAVGIAKAMNEQQNKGPLTFGPGVDKVVNPNMLSLPGSNTPVAPDSWMGLAPDSKSGGGGGGDKKNPLIAQIEAIREALMTENELLTAGYAQQREQLGEALDQRLITQKEFEALSLESAKQYQDAKAALIHQERSASLGLYAGMFGKLAAIAEAGGKKMVGIAKAASIAQASINAYKAYTEVLASKNPAYEAVPGLRMVDAGLTLAAGLAQVSAIRSVSYGSSGSGGGGGGGGGGSTAAAAPQKTSQAVALNLQGDNFSRDQVLTLINSINEAVEDGAVVRLV